MSKPVVQLMGSDVVVTLTGDVDLVVGSDILESYHTAVGLVGVAHLLVDVSGVTFMDATGIGTLAVAVNAVRARGGTVSVVGASRRIVRLLHLTRFDDVVTVLPKNVRPFVPRPSAASSGPAWPFEAPA